MEKKADLEAAKNDVIDLAQARPERTLLQNPLTWWGDTPIFLWNFKYGGFLGLWNGAGEMEALGELFFDNLATMLSITDLMLGFFLNVLIKSAANNIDDTGAYGDAIVNRYTTLYYERCIPGVAVGLVFGNVYYAWMAGRLAYKENRDDVTAQPYGINTTGAFITLGAVNLTALFTELFKEQNINAALRGDGHSTGQKVANDAYKIAVGANFYTGLMEIAGCLLAEPIRALVPSPAYYSLLTGVGFVYLAFSPMLKIAAEPILCLLPLLIVLVGFFGGVKYHIGKTGLTVPVALVAILTSCLLGWLGGCKHKHDAVEMYNYGDSYVETEFGFGSGSPGQRNMFFDSKKWATCTGTSKHDASYAYRTYAGDISSFGGGIFNDVGAIGDKEMKDYIGIIIVVGVVGFGASLACVESASAAGDDYPMAETLIIDGLGTCLGACFGSFYGTTVYIGHPIHKTLGARRGYSVINGLAYFVLLWSGLFAVLYRTIPVCANGALLVFVGLFICRQAIEDNPPDYYPAIFFGLFPCLCNWAKLYVDPGVAWNNASGAWWDSADAGNWGQDGMGIAMMGQGGGEWFTLIMTAIFCYCTDRDFLKGAVISAAACIVQTLTAVPTLYNRTTKTGKMGPEKAGMYPKINKDTNFSWMWSVAFAMATAFFLLHYGLQKAGLIDPVIIRNHIKRKGEVGGEWTSEVEDLTNKTGDKSGHSDYPDVSERPGVPRMGLAE